MITRCGYAASGAAASLARRNDRKRPTKPWGKKCRSVSVCLRDKVRDKPCRAEGAGGGERGSDFAY